MEAFISFLWKPRTPAEISEILKIHAGRLTRFIHLVSNTRGLQLDRTQTETGIMYKIKDFRASIA